MIHYSKQQGTPHILAILIYSCPPPIDQSIIKEISQNKPMSVFMLKRK